MKELLSEEKSYQSKRNDGKKLYRDEEIIRFNQELDGVFKDLLESIDDSQVRQMTLMSDR